MRVITVASTSKSGAQQISTSAETWGELIEVLQGKGFGDVGNMRAVIRETKVDLVSPESVIPSDNFTLLITPRQIKAGTTDVDVVKILEALKERFNNSIDEVIEEVERGEYNKPAVATKLSNVSSSLQRDLDDLKNGNF